MANETLTACRRFRFSLWAMIVVLALAGTVGYWGFRHYAYEQALYEYEAGYAGWQAQTVTTADVCERSLRLFRAEAAVPFANRSAAAKANLDRVEKIRKVVYHIASIGMFGGTDSPHKSVEEIDRYYADAKRLANE
jgi:uncharacterized membrane protein